MTKREMIMQILKREKPLIDIWHYLVGNYRYKLYYYDCRKLLFCRSPRKHLLMRQHIYEQIKFRINNMNKLCYENGSCIKCGCNTTELQMANKPCKGYEYPPMMSNRDWERYKIGRYTPRYDGYMWIVVNKDIKNLKIVKETEHGCIQIN